jgi:hypothetical protein
MTTTISSRTRNRFVLALALVGAALYPGAFASTAEAGTYHVWQCGAQHGGPAANDVGNNNAGNSSGNAGYTSRNDCANLNVPNGFSYAFGHQAFAGAPTGYYRAYDIFAPPGTRFLNGSVEGNLFGLFGHEPRISVGNGSTLWTVAGNGSGGWQNHQWTAPFENTIQLVVWMVCASGNGWCDDVDGYSVAYARNLVFNVQDYTAPDSAIGGSLIGGGWRNSGGTISVGGSDSGSGVHYVDQYINGAHVNRSSTGCALTTLFGGTVGYQLTPCPTTHSAAMSVSTGAFQQGANSYAGCTYDFATDGNPNGVCSTATILIDTVAPALGGSGVSVAGGTDWRPTNDFDITWSNPHQAHAPIDGAYYRLTKVGGGYDSGAQFVAGANLQSLDDLQVPSPGEFQLKVWTRDQAGNHAEANAQSTTLRYDPTVPPASQAQYNGWIRKNDFPYVAQWQQVAQGGLGPSGLEGYAVSVTKDPASDPCVTEEHPQPDCSNAEINNGGIADIEMPVSERADGSWYIHVVPVSGAGVKAPVRHTAMPVDREDPATSIEGAGDGWTNRDVAVRVTATDALSGMSPDLTNAVDPQPRTCIRVGEGTVDCASGAEATKLITTEGAHSVAYFARDLAGNENSGGSDAEYPAKTNNPPNTATVRIDKTAPEALFAAREVEDPAKVVVATSDALSGVTEGTIELRKAGSSGSWTGLATSLEGRNLVARVPDDLEPGRYAFRAQVTDRAGNTGVSDRRADGSAMVEELPLKEAAHLSAVVAGPRGEASQDKPKKKCKDRPRPKKCRGKGNGGHRAEPAAVKVPYGQSMKLSGILRTTDDKPLAGRELFVTEQMAAGAEPQSRTTRTSTNGYGAYELELEAGPSRRVTVSFAGDSRYRATESVPVDVGVKARVLRFKASKTVPETKPIRFRGQVGVMGVGLAQTGKRIELEYQKGRNWKTIDSGQTKPDGTFRLKYGLRSDYLQRTRVRFRIAVPPEGAWPYAGKATSRVRKTIILP